MLSTVGSVMTIGLAVKLIETPAWEQERTRSLVVRNFKGLTGFRQIVLVAPSLKKTKQALLG